MAENLSTGRETMLLQKTIAMSFIEMKTAFD
jgi:hypothetical protein